MKTPFTFAFLVVLSSAQSQTLTLEQSLALARDNRLVNRAAQLNSESARLTSHALGASPSLSLGIGRSSAPGFGATDQDLFISHSIDLFGRTSANRRVGAAQILLAEAEQRQTRLNIQTEVMTTYFHASTAAKLSQVSIELRRIAEAVYSATVRRFEEGKVPEVQLTRATIELDRAKQVAALKESQFQASLKRLAAVIGSERTPVNVDPDATFADPRVHLSTRPDIAILAAKIRFVEAEASVAYRSTFPELELLGLRNSWQDGPAAYGARLQLTWRIFDFGKSKNEWNASQKQTESLKALLSDTTKRAEQDLIAIDIDIHASKQSLSAYESMRKSAIDLVEKSQRGFSEGFGSLLDVLDATRSLREIEQELAEAKLAVNLALVSKYQAAGTLMETSK